MVATLDFREALAALLGGSEVITSECAKLKLTRRGLEVLFCGSSRWEVSLAPIRHDLRYSIATPRTSRAVITLPWGLSADEVRLRDVDGLAFAIHPCAAGYAATAWFPGDDSYSPIALGPAPTLQAAIELCSDHARCGCAGDD